MHARDTPPTVGDAAAKDKAGARPGQTGQARSARPPLESTSRVMPRGVGQSSGRRAFDVSKEPWCGAARPVILAPLGLPPVARRRLAPGTHPDHDPRRRAPAAQSVSPQLPAAEPFRVTHSDVPGRAEFRIPELRPTVRPVAACLTCNLHVRFAHGTVHPDPRCPRPRTQDSASPGCRGRTLTI
jgi:hypothetical protein